MTEYHYHDCDTFEIQVYFLSRDEIREQCTKLLQDYRDFHLHGIRMEHNERLDPSESAQVARETLQAMFGGRLTDDKFLVGPDEAQILNTLTQWADDAMPSPFIAFQPELSELACFAQLMELNSDFESRDKSSVWPFVRKIEQDKFFYPVQL